MGRPLTQVSNCESAVLLPASTPFFRSFLLPPARGHFRPRFRLSHRARAHDRTCLVTQFRSNRKPVAPLRFRHASRTTLRRANSMLLRPFPSFPLSVSFHSIPTLQGLGKIIWMFEAIVPLVVKGKSLDIRAFLLFSLVFLVFSASMSFHISWPITSISRSTCSSIANRCHSTERDTFSTATLIPTE